MSAAATSTLESIRTNLNAGGQHVGDLCWWSLFDSQIAAPTFEAIWKEAGLNADLLSRPPTPERSLKDAGRDAMFKRAGYLFRLAARTDDRTIYAIVRENPRGDGTIEYAQEAWVSVTALGDFASDVSSHPIVQDVRARYDALAGGYTSREIRASILRTLDHACAVSIREAGGVYWVPAPYADVGRKLKSVVDRVGSSIFCLLPVHETQVGNEALGYAARGALEAELAKLKDEIAEFQAAPPNAATLERRLAAFAELQSRAGLYRDLLAVEVSDLESKLGELSDSVKGILGGLEEAA